MANKYTYTNNGISFTLKQDDTTKVSNYGKLHKYSNIYEYAEEDGIEPFINAVEIDWNSATLGDKVINSTGELLSYVSNAYTLAATAATKTAGVTSIKLQTTSIPSIHPAHGDNFNVVTGISNSTGDVQLELTTAYLPDVPQYTIDTSKNAVTVDNTTIKIVMNNNAIGLEVVTENVWYTTAALFDEGVVYSGSSANIRITFSNSAGKTVNQTSGYSVEIIDKSGATEATTVSLGTITNNIGTLTVNAESGLSSSGEIKLKFYRSGGSVPINGSASTPDVSVNILPNENPTYWTSAYDFSPTTINVGENMDISFSLSADTAVTNLSLSAKSDDSFAGVVTTDVTVTKITDTTGTGKITLHGISAGSAKITIYHMMNAAGTIVQASIGSFTVTVAEATTDVYYDTAVTAAGTKINDVSLLTSEDEPVQIPNLILSNSAGETVTDTTISVENDNTSAATISYTVSAATIKWSASPLSTGKSIISVKNGAGDILHYKDSTDEVKFTVTVKEPYYLAANPEQTTINIAPGSSANITLNPQPNAEFVSDTTITAESDSSVVTANVSDNILTIAVDSGASSGSTYTVTLYNGKKSSIGTVIVTVEETTTYKYYLGLNAESALTSETGLQSLIDNSTTTLTEAPSTINVLQYTTDNPYMIYIYPTAWGTPTITYNKAGTGDMTADDLGLTNVPTGYDIRVWEKLSMNMTFDVTWTK